MSISWFCVWQQRDGSSKPELDAYDLNALQALLRGCPKMVEGHIMTPVDAHDPYFADTAHQSPPLVLQLEFNKVSDLEELLKPAGYLCGLVDPAFLPSIKGAEPAHQAMLTRRYPVANDVVATEDGHCVSYWVEYSGPAEDENAWLTHYTASHPHLLSKFPGIRKIEIYTPAVVICGLPMPVRPCMQRNKTVFDTPAAMSAAMQSPVRPALREDFHKLPPFKGNALHYPYRTVSCVGA